MPPNEFVSMMSEPASRYLRWIPSTTSGRVITRFSLQPSRCGPPKSAAVRSGLLQHGAHRAIQDKDALTEKFAKGQALLYQVSHVFGIIPWEAPQGKAASRLLPREREHPPPASPREALNATLNCEDWKEFSFTLNYMISLQKFCVLGLPRSFFRPPRKETPPGNEEGTRPAAIPRAKSSCTARRPSSP